MANQNTELDDDTNGEVISLNGEATGAGSEGDQPSEPEDRGDNLPGEADADTLKAIVKDAPAGTDADDAAGDPKPTGARIPKARLDEVINQRETFKGERDALKEQLAEANRQLLARQTPGEAPPKTTAAPETPSADLKALRTQAREALMEGDMDKAAELDDLIDAEVLRVAEARFEQKQASRAHQSALQTESANALADFPYLDTPEGAEALDLIVMSRDRKIAAGIEPSRALREAVATIAPRFQPDGEQGTPQQGLSDGTKPTDTRSANALARGAADSTQQPPSIQAGVGNRATAARVDVTKLSEAQFEELPEAEKKRLRGD